MGEPAYLALIHAEIDGKIDAPQAAELARLVQTDPKAAALRDGLRRLCVALDNTESVAPPPELAASIMAALPKPQSMAKTRVVPSTGTSPAALRYAAILAGVLATGAILYIGISEQKVASSDLAGTLTGANHVSILETVKLPDGPLVGRVSLTRSRAGLGLSFELSGSTSVDVIVSSGGRSFKIDSLNTGGSVAVRTVALPPGLGADGQAVNVTFLAGGTQVAVATLAARGDR
jgi:hypothetical protein